MISDSEYASNLLVSQPSLARRGIHCIESHPYYRTGATGYIGGEILHVLQQTNPDYNIAALIRDQEKASKISAAFPNVRVVFADLDNVDIIEEESRKANVVIRESRIIPGV